MYLPTKLASHISSTEGCTLVWSEDEIMTLALMGDTVPVGPRSEFRIPQHHAPDPDLALRIIRGYSRLASDNGYSCVFRGQTRDFYNSSGGLIVLPTALRSPELGIRYILGQRSFFDELRLWLKVLENLGIDARGVTSLHTTRQPDGQEDHWICSSGGARQISTNPTLGAILQHYGFPTDQLDATTDPNVAFWFALHAASSNAGKIAFQPVSPPSKAVRRNPPEPVDTAGIPSLYVYLEPHCLSDRAVIDLTLLEPLVAVAKRPSVQSAVSLGILRPFLNTQSPRFIPTFSMLTELRWPAAIIKLYFPFDVLNCTHITSDYLFPKNEPLYTHLLECNLPHLAMYA